MYLLIWEFWADIHVTRMMSFGDVQSDNTIDAAPKLECSVMPFWRLVDGVAAASCEPDSDRYTDGDSWVQSGSGILIEDNS